MDESQIVSARMNDCRTSHGPPAGQNSSHPSPVFGEADGCDLIGRAVFTTKDRSWDIAEMTSEDLD